MKVETFEYELPPSFIAQYPTAQRETARLLVVGRDGALDHRTIADLTSVIEPGSLIVINDTRVFPARLLGRKVTGGRVEWLLVRRIEARNVYNPDDLEGAAVAGEVWHALAKGAASREQGATFEIAGRDEASDGPSPLGLRVLGSSTEGFTHVLLWPRSGGSVRGVLDSCGHVPLPPYIKRDAELDDKSRYQTVFAKQEGAIAAPTAGLHLTRSILDALKEKGSEIATVTLHVGLGTFQPVQVADLDQHPMHAEWLEVSEATAAAVARARMRGAPVVAIGTTTVRALETAADLSRIGHVRAMSGETRLLIQPGHPWHVVDAMLTNFHQPRSTLMALVCAFAGTELVLRAYRTAVNEKYRFLSYGDAMFLRRAW